MKKYYGYFIYGDNEYVIRFRINGSLHWRPEHKCFEDKDFYVRSIADVICLAALDSNPMNNKKFRFSMLVTHDRFKELRARGVPRWNPWRPIVEWD